MTEEEVNELVEDLTKEGIGMRDLVKIVSLCDHLQKNQRTLLGMVQELQAEVKQLQDVIKTQA